MKTQTDSLKYEGQCKFCQQDFSKRQIAAHLDVCSKRKEDKNIKNLRLRVVDPYMKNFWLIVEVNERANFNDLDNLIKDVWVECCGHLSLFGDYQNEVSKKKIIADILKPKDSIGYIYDFGSSTELTVEALEYSNHQLIGKKNIELVARNYLPPSDCVKCGRQATYVCVYCCESEPALVCDKCAEKYHNEDDKKTDHCVALISNSPRSGVCGYAQEGSLDKLF
ncbi:hypothetical protein KKE99_01165 [Patescibacteria group bacterium]|nr:hypothetical protein [Patescibacteria group bacterium]